MLSCCYGLSRTAFTLTDLCVELVRCIVAKLAAGTGFTAALLHYCLWLALKSGLSARLYTQSPKKGPNFLGYKIQIVKPSSLMRDSEGINRYTKIPV